MQNFCLCNSGFTNRNNCKNTCQFLLIFLIYLSKKPLQRPTLYSVELNTKPIANGRQVRQNEEPCFKVLTRTFYWQNGESHKRRSLQPREKLDTSRYKSIMLPVSLYARRCNLKRNISHSSITGSFGSYLCLWECNTPRQFEFYFFIPLCMEWEVSSC